MLVKVTISPGLSSSSSLLVLSALTLSSQVPRWLLLFLARFERNKSNFLLLFVLILLLALAFVFELCNRLKDFRQSIRDLLYHLLQACDFLLQGVNFLD